MSSLEREVLRAMLSPDFDGVEDLRQQMDGLQVTGGCGCSCPTANFREGSNGLCLVAEGVVEAGDRSVLLFVGTDGQIESMELMWLTDEPPSEFPNPACLRVTSR